MQVNGNDGTGSKKEDKKGNTEASLIGQELYNNIQAFLKEYQDGLVVKGLELLSEYEVLEFYTEQWEMYQLSAKVLNGICAYLNR